MEQKYTSEERVKMLEEMRAASGVFYALAQRTHIHQFLEVTGFLNELVKIYERMHNEGKDFGTEPIDPKTFEMAYIGEKFDCIFGDALARPEMRQAFLESLEQKGGWKWNEKPIETEPSDGARRAALRSTNYNELSGQEQWDQDRALGILDWDGR